nr:SPOR domain-containing protein [uncultured Dongia sp.]
MTTEPPRPDQIQANVAAALSRLRGELAPTPPGAAPGANFDANTKPNEVDQAVAAGEPAYETGAGLSAPDPSMALNLGKSGGDMTDSPFARMTGIKPTEQPDLLASIGTTPPPLADLPDAEAEAAHRKRRFRNRLLAGGALIIALGAFWFLSGGGDSTNEPVPVITADSTPEKVKPADEGGLEVPNQDVAILNGENSTVPAEGETVLPAPEQPATPPVVLEPAPEVAAPATDPAASSNAEIAIPSVPAPSVDAIPSVPAPADTTTADTGATPVAEAAPAPATTSETTPATADATTTAEAAPTAAAPAQTATAEPATGGSARIQLAAVKTEAAAQKEWARLQKMHPDVLGPLTLHVEKFEKSASETFYRIQAGPFADKASAKQICAQLKQKDQACIVAN